MSVRQLLNLKGRTALITGTSSGLGLQMARALGEMGAHIAILDRDGDALRCACAELQGEGILANGVQCDLRQVDTIADAVGEAAGQ